MKILNYILFERLVSLERQCWANAQYSRRKRKEMVGVTRSVRDIDLERKVSKVLEKVGFPIEGNNDEICYSISRTNERIIVKFSRRKDRKIYLTKHYT